MEKIKVKSEVNLRKLMQKLGMGTNEFAKACGVTTQSMSQYLRPDKSLTTTTIYKIAAALDIDPRDMFFPTDENSLSAKDTSGEPIAETKGYEIPQDAQQVLSCPNCGTRFLVMNVPYNVENKIFNKNKHETS